jgi:hypothetical protein
MGDGRWNEATYRSARSERVAKGVDDFAYSKSVQSGQTAAIIHETLDPKKIKGVRESRDSSDHPESLPVAVFFDVTGSMRTLPRTFQQKLPNLMSLLTRRGNIKDPHVLFGAVGDAYADRFPFQVGQFEADNRCDEQLRNAILEGGGGGGGTESYELALYFGGYKVALDSVEKRKKKGYLFTMGDERFYDKLPRSKIYAVFGESPQADLSFDELLQATLQNFEYYHIHVQQGSYRNRPDILDPWREALGQRLLLLDDADLVCELIASTISMCEGVPWEEVKADLGPAAASLANTVSSVQPVRIYDFSEPDTELVGGRA